MLVCHVVAVVLLVSWLWQPTRELWNVFDVWLFKLLNDPVHAGGLWAHIWAIGSMRPVDAGVGVVGRGRDPVSGSDRLSRANGLAHCCAGRVLIDETLPQNPACPSTIGGAQPAAAEQSTRWRTVAHPTTPEAN